MKTTINKIITVASGLAVKYSNINTDLTDIILSDEEISDLNIRLDIVSGIFSSGSNDNIEKTYVYTISNAGTEKANGDYWDTGELINGYPSYVNANGVKIYCLLVAGYGQWVIGEDFLYYSWWNGDTVYNPLEECTNWNIYDSGDSPAPTGTKYIN